MSGDTVDRRRGRWGHRIVIAVALLGVVATGLAVWRALVTQPHCDGTRGNLTPARSGDEPAPVSGAQPGVLARTASAPLLVDGRLRVLATGDRVWAEPITGSTGIDGPYWSCHGSATVTGVVADGAAPATVVVSWSDGQLDAMDAATGRVRWHRAVTPDTRPPSGPLAPTYPDSGLFLLRTLTRDVLVVARPGGLSGFAVADGGSLWTRPSAGPNCDGAGFSTAYQLDGAPVGMTYVFHDNCAISEHEVNPLTGKDVRTLNGDGNPLGDGWRVVPDACQWRNVGCAVFAWVQNADFPGLDAVPAASFPQQITQKYNPPPPFLIDTAQWDSSQTVLPSVAVATGSLLTHPSYRDGITSVALDRGGRSWSNKAAGGYLYGDGQRAYEVTPESIKVFDPTSGALSTLATLSGLHEVTDQVSGVAVSGDLAVVVGSDGTSLIVALG